MELKAYSLIGMSYYYLGDLSKSILFENRFINRKIEPESSHLRSKVKLNVLEGYSDDEADEIQLLEDTTMLKSDNGDNNNSENDEFSFLKPGEKLKILRDARQAQAKYKRLDLLKK